MTTQASDKLAFIDQELAALKESGLYINIRTIESAQDYTGPNLRNGIASINIQLPDDAKPGQVMEYLAMVEDVVATEAFRNRMLLTVRPASRAGVKTNGSRTKPPGREDGTGGESSGGIALPEPVRVYQRQRGGDPRVRAEHERGPAGVSLRGLAARGGALARVGGRVSSRGRA